VLRTRASVGSVEVLNELLEYEDCDVDYTNHLEGATPLHLAVKIKGPELRAFIVDSLLDAGADTRFGFTLTWSLLPSVLRLIPIVSKTRRVKCPWTMYLKMTQKRETHSAAIRP
jgi:ankyrin repeat protein